MSWRRKPDGRPYADVLVNGRRRRVSLLLRGERAPYPDDAECERRYRVYVEQVAPNFADTPRAGPLTLRALFDWYADVVMVARGNAEGSRANARVTFSEFAGWMRTRNVLTVADLEQSPVVAAEYVADRLRVRAPYTVRTRLVILRAAFRAAVAHGIIEREPVRRWEIPRQPQPRMDIEPLTPAQLAALFDAMRGGTYYNVVRFLAFVGCRPSDACNLTWGRVLDLGGDNPRAEICQQKTGGWISVPLVGPALDAVREEFGRRRSPWVFVTRRGQKMHPLILANALRRISVRVLGIVISPKRFRQTVTSALFDAGCDQALIQAITGHRSDAIEAYRKLRRGQDRAVAERLAEALSPPDVTPTAPPHVSR